MSIVISNESVSQRLYKGTDLISSGQMMAHLFQAAHHPLISEVIGKRLCPLSQQLQDLGTKLPHFSLGGRDAGEEDTVRDTGQESFQ